MSVLGNVWTSLTFSTGKAAVSLASRAGVRIDGGDAGPLIYKNRRHQSALLHEAKLASISAVNGRLQQVLPKFSKWVSFSDYGAVDKQRRAHMKQLIGEQEEDQKEDAKITLKDAEGKVVGTDFARDAYGNLVHEALIVSYDGKDTHMYKATDVKVDVNTGRVTKTQKNVKTATVLAIDLSPQVSMSSAKNIVMTQVQGRDYTRKELVSGGDLQWTVRGNIVGDSPYVYPTGAVQRFLSIMQYNGIVNVNHIMFNRANVKHVIIKDFNLEPPMYKNIQPYSFTCVAVEPDEEVRVKDTVIKLNKELQASPMDTWYVKILKGKLGQTATSVATSSTAQGMGMGLDALVPNI